MPWSRREISTYPPWRDRSVGNIFLFVYTKHTLRWTTTHTHNTVGKRKRLLFFPEQLSAVLKHWQAFYSLCQKSSWLFIIHGFGRESGGVVRSDSLSAWLFVSSCYFGFWLHRTAPVCCGGGCVDHGGGGDSQLYRDRESTTYPIRCSGEVRWDRGQDLPQAADLAMEDWLKPHDFRVLM